jgi:hypothetical protein
MMSKAEQQELYERIRFLQENGHSDDSLDQWAQRYEGGQVARARLDLDEMGDAFVVLVSNHVAGRTVRAIGPFQGRLDAEAFAAQKDAAYKRDMPAVEWKTEVVPFDTDVEDHRTEAEWILSGKADEELEAERRADGETGDDEDGSD